MDIKTVLKFDYVAWQQSTVLLQELAEELFILIIVIMKTFSVDYYNRISEYLKEYYVHPQKQKKKMYYGFDMFFF